MSLEVPKPVHEYRLKICEKCPLLLREEGQPMTTVRCGDCGCFVYIKSNLKDFTCPQGKW
jgi:hypothetical protein